MPYGQEKDGRFYFVGNLASWIEDYQKWWAEDLPNTSPETFRYYMFHLTLAYGVEIYKLWTSQNKDTSGLRAMLMQDPQTAAFKHDVFEIMDYLAENANECRILFSRTARNEAKNTMKEMNII